MSLKTEENRMYDKINWKIVASCTAGFVAGAVATLLYTPVKGETVRENVKEKISSSYTSVSTGVKHYAGAPAANASAARLQIERLFAAVSAGVEEARKTRRSFDLK